MGMPLGAAKIDNRLTVERDSSINLVVALAGNPNVGKSTVFNHITGLNQHTGNWPGKTVANAHGFFTYDNKKNILVDVPGAYSLIARSYEEEVARDFICFGNADAIIVVCDATCLERNLNLVLQILELTGNVVLCVNLMDEAKKKGITIDLKKLSKRIGIPVIATNAAMGEGVENLKEAVNNMNNSGPVKITYSYSTEEAAAILEPYFKNMKLKNPRWVSLKLLEGDDGLIKALCEYTGLEINDDIQNLLTKAKVYLGKSGQSQESVKDEIASRIVCEAEDICKTAVIFNKPDYNAIDRKLDHLLTSKFTGTLAMLILLALIFWITLSGANYPSQLIFDALFRLQAKLPELFRYIHIPEPIMNMFVYGIYQVVAWVISVMLPPMAIFFPLFTLFEDLGYLPRVAFNLDYFFKKCGACGKQALTMCMGFGCNAAGVIGCRIIDSPRERLIAIITNNLVPCNGRFPMLTAIITMFFVSDIPRTWQSFLAAVLLTFAILIGILMTFAISKILSATVLKGVPSSFILELPPYRKPQILKVAVRSMMDRTMSVLVRAVVSAIPAGLIIWLMSNVYLDSTSILAHVFGFLDPFAKVIGLDGIILTAFILGFPANEIVIPIIIMAYLSQNNIMNMESLSSLKGLLTDNGWTWLTAVNTMIFSIMHWPCSTTCLTIRKETQSLKWTALSFITPTIAGIVFCLLTTGIARLLNLV